MSTTDAPETLSLHINRYDFTIPSRYLPGHILTEGEAKALNQLMMENIRNNVAPWVKAAEADAPGGALTLDRHVALQLRIYDYACNYQFLVRSRARPISAIEAAINELASAEAEAWGTRRSLGPEDPAVQTHYHQLLTSPEIRNRARLVVAERTRVTNSTLAEIFSTLEC